ncbi:hypothetical protein [Chitinimonas lacunae]|uniref:Uncharacterized protein n=1 Tax=Chitinimonas lacunae TaxID=1963018 RepID=A0ABV8MJH4_9NEIS
MTNSTARPVSGAGELILGRPLDGAADLHLGRPRGDPVEAVVGVLDARDDAGADGELQVVAAGVLAGADARADGFLLPVLSLAGSGGDAGSAAGVLHYDHAVPRGAGATTSSGWRPAAGRGAGAAAGWRAHDPAGTTSISSWSPAGAGAASTSAPWASQLERAGSASSSWRAAVPTAADSAAPWSAMPARAAAFELDHRHALPAGIESAAPWIDLVPRAGASTQTWREAGSAALDISASASPAAPVQLATSIPWREARRPAYGHTPPIPVPPTPPPPPPGTVPPPPPAGSTPTRLHLAHRIEPSAPTLLWLGRADPVGIRVPSLRVYIVVNKIRMWRISDGAPLSPTSVSISTDDESWTWSLTATLPGNQRLLVLRQDPREPVEIGVELNGLRWTFVVTATSGSRQFGSASATITGRSLAAYLGDGFAEKRAWTESAPIAARQIAERALEGTGTALDWRLPDWLIPPGCWSMTDATPIDVINRLATAVGGTVLAGADSTSLRLAPRYPVAPWEWGAAVPDIILPPGPVTVQQWNDQDMPDYNAVYIAGDRTGGVVGRVVRQGSAGDKLAPQVTDTLITDVAAARACGMSILANTGPQASISLELPLLPDLGRVTHGQLLEFDGLGELWRSLVRGITINAQSGGDQKTVIKQTLTVERHYT